MNELIVKLSDFSAQLASHAKRSGLDAGPAWCESQKALIDKAVAALSAQPSLDAAQPALTVWCAPMPESNGKSNFTAILMRKGGDFVDGFTIDISEYPDRVRYEADRVRYLIGELKDRPDILDYDADKHSGYTAPASPDAAQGEVDSLLAMLMRYTEDFYATAIEHGMRAGPVADSVAHIERAAKRLHALASTSVAQGSEHGREVPQELSAVEEVLAEGEGFWRSCTGCHELNEGHDTGPYSKTLGCALGLGCGECGGIGAVWDSTDYAAMAASMEAEDDPPTSPQPVQGGAESVADEEVMPWRKGTLACFSICGMNHYHAGGERKLFVSMTRFDKCIKAEGPDGRALWEELEKAAQSALSHSSKGDEHE